MRSDSCGKHSSPRTRTPGPGNPYRTPGAEPPPLLPEPYPGTTVHERLHTETMAADP